MKIINAEYIKSCVEIEECPTDKPEFAFIGRSNVGKSSLVNFLAEKKNLAKISSKPGKTQTINYFLINYLWYLVDLPGYGFAKTSKTQRSEFMRIIKNYILRSPNLLNVFVLVDSTIPPQVNDIDFINQLGINEIPLSVIFTKSDKVSKNILHNNMHSFKEKLLESWEDLPPVFVTSTMIDTGRTEILDFIDGIMKNYKSKV